MEVWQKDARGGVAQRVWVGIFAELEFLLSWQIYTRCMRKLVCPCFLTCYIAKHAADDDNRRMHKISRSAIRWLGQAP